MGTINQVKQLAAADTPLLFFKCEMATGDTFYWSTHSLLFEGQQYTARVLKHNAFTLQLSAGDAMEGLTQLSIVFGNADGMMSELNAALGFRGALLTVNFAFVDLMSGTATTEAMMLFSGIAGDPEEITEETLSLSFTNKLSLQRVALPDVRIQRTCPWNFPATAAQRQEAVDGGTYGRFSKFYRCGYSADVPNGAGNLNGGVAFTSCDGSRTQCLQRGMFNSDSKGQVNNRYGGFEFIPTAYLVRTAGSNVAHLSAVIDNTAKANDAVPIVYGTGWLRAPVVFSRNDGNLTHMEVLLGLGVITQILKVVVNDVEIPIYSGNANPSATGWYSIVSLGTRIGNFNSDFVDSSGNPLGDPQGSMAVLSVVVPNDISAGTSSPFVQVLLAGLQVDTYDASSVKLAPVVSNNPAWIILDILQRAGWRPSDLNIATFYQASEYCSELIATSDVNGNSINIPRYGCNLILNKRQSAATLVRGVRVGAGLMLRYGSNGLLELIPETSIAVQQSLLPDGSNSVDTLNGGWPAYEFSDASDVFSGLARTSKGDSSVRLSALSIAETFNCISVEFQDEANEYQQDSLSLENTFDSALIGFEVGSQSTALGLPNYNQATRVLLRQLDKSTEGNQYIEFQTSFRALKVRPGDIIAVTYLREGLQRTPFRVIKLSPSLNYESVTILAQFHDDGWYSDNPAMLQPTGRQPDSGLGSPRPLLGTVPHLDAGGNLEFFDFAITDSINSQQDGSAIDSISVGFSVPTKPSSTATYLPLVSLSTVISPTGGVLLGGTTWYYAVTAVDSSGMEGSLSFTVAAAIPETTNTNTVTLQGLSFPSSSVSFSVYRGSSPQTLYLIAQNQALPTNSMFVDNGHPPLDVGPPDANFDHANFYYRNEYAGPFQADIYGVAQIGWSNMGAVTGAYVNMVALIIEGTGRGQQGSIVSNTTTTLSLSSPWLTQPDATSVFVIAEASWKLCAISSYSPAQFDVPYHLGAVLEVTGRAANVLNQESNAQLAPITRFTLGGGNQDAGLPGLPSCTLQTPGGGDLTILEVGFSDLTNAYSVASGTLEIFYWNELDTPSLYSLSQTIDSTEGTIYLNAPPSSQAPYVGQLIQVEQELMSVVSANAAGNMYTVARAVAGSEATTHSAGAAILQLRSYCLVMTFSPGFFENRASNNYVNTVTLPDIRISASQFFVTNSFGNSQANFTSYVGNQTALRTLSGGQFALQVNGYLATQTNAAPPLVVEATHAVRDLRLTLGQPPSGYIVTLDLLQNGTQYCQLTYDPTQSTPSNVIDGLNLPPVQEAALLTMNVILTPIPNFNAALNPGRDLTVTIRF